VLAALCYSFVRRLAPAAKRLLRLEIVATCGYNYSMVSAGIRELKNNLSRYMRQVEAGGRVAVTAHGRVIAELVPPSLGAQSAGVGRYQELVAAGVIEPAEEAYESPPEWPDILLSGGAVAELIDSDRGEP
jgi:prevent-host-death family protein